MRFTEPRNKRQWILHCKVNPLHSSKHTNWRRKQETNVKQYRFEQSSRPSKVLCLLIISLFWTDFCCCCCFYCCKLSKICTVIGRKHQTHPAVCPWGVMHQSNTMMISKVTALLKTGKFIVRDDNFVSLIKVTHTFGTIFAKFLSENQMTSLNCFPKCSFIS